MDKTFSEGLSFSALVCGFYGILQREIFQSGPLTPAASKAQTRARLALLFRLEACNRATLFTEVQKIAEENELRIEETPTTWEIARHFHIPSFCVCDEGSIIITLKGFVSIDTPTGQVPPLPTHMTRYRVFKIR